MAKAAAKPMTKKEIIDFLSEKSGLNKKQTEEFITLYNDLVYKQTKKMKEFVMPGLGKWVTAKTKARQGRNPATGETIKIPAKTVVKFRVAKAAKDSIL
ncbi:MAG: HU family DNA-binding protein [Bacteroidetes bacterium]|nr:HU family DNA-binding protein [Bacteroidota bacterium]